MAKEIKLSFREFAEFIYSDYTVEVFPDIAYPLDVRFKNPRINWLTEAMEKRYADYITAEPEDDDTESTQMETDDEDN